MSALREKLGSNISATIAMVLFLGSIIYITLEKTKNTHLDHQLKDELLAKESLLSEKLSLMKENEITKSNYKDIREKNHSLESSIKILRNKLEDANRQIDESKSQSASLSRLIKENKQLSVSNRELKVQLSELQNSSEQLRKSNDDMNFMVAFLQQENEELKNECKAPGPSSLNDMLIEPMKRNKKLTIKANNIRTMTVNIDVPVNAANLSFRIFDPTGKELKEQEGRTEIVKTAPLNEQSGQAFYASNKAFPQSYERIKMIYTPKEKLVAGIYKIEVSSEMRPIGSLQVRLR